MKPTMSDEDRDAGFGRALRPGERPALLMIDFVRAYLEPDSPLYAGVEAVRERCVALLAFARERRLPEPPHTGRPDRSVHRLDAAPAQR